VLVSITIYICFSIYIQNIEMSIKMILYFNIIICYFIIVFKQMHNQQV